MKKIKQIIICYAIAATAFTMSSCNNFLDLKPISELTTDNAYTSASELEAALVGCYNQFYTEYYVWDNINFSDVRSDNYYAGGDDAQIYEIDELRVTENNTRLFSQLWKPLYEGINRCNTVLENAPKVEDLSLDKGNRRLQIMGEASFIRAKHYFELVKLFGGVPLMLTPTTSADASQTNVARASEKEVYDQIVIDLEYAAKHLPYKYGDDPTVNKARATRGAAHALLAKAWAQRSDRDYSKVLQYCDSVRLNPIGYKLIDFKFLFDGNHYNNEESIMEVQYLGGSLGNWGPQMLLPPSISGDGWRKFVVPSNDLVAAYDAEGDMIRKETSILYEKVDWIDEYWSANGGGIVPFAFRWKSANGWSSTNRQYILRYGDIRLLEAEAFNQTGNTAQAILILNEMRGRVNLPATNAASKEQVALAIENERRLELAQEGERWYDLVRSGRVVEVMDKLVVKNLVTGKTLNFNMSTDKILLPMPRQEMNRNPLILPNPSN